LAKYCYETANKSECKCTYNGFIGQCDNK